MYLRIGARTRTRAHSRRNSAAVFYLHKIKPSFSRCLRTSLQSCCDRFLRKCLMTQRSASSFGPAGGATARWQGVESNICLSTLSGSPLAARGCKKSCRRLRLARVMPPEALGCHDWTSHSRDTPTRGHHTPRFVIKAIQGDLHVLFRH